MNSFYRRRFSWMLAISAAVLCPFLARPALAQVEVAEERELDADEEPAGELKTIGVVAAAPYEKLIEHINFLGSLAGKPEMGQMIEGGLAFLTQGKGVNLLDKKQPWGLILQTDGNTLLAVGCMPVKQKKDLLDLAKGYGAQVTDGENGVSELLLPNQQTYFLKHENGWAFISNSAESLAVVPADPQAILGDLVTDYDVAARLKAKDVPEAWRQLAIAYMQMGMQEGMKQRESESDDEYEQRREMAQMQIEQLQRMINEIESVTVGWAVDPAQQRTFFDFTYVFVPGSKTAEQIAAYGEPTTNFAGFYQPDAAATMTFATKADPETIKEDIAQFETMTRTLREQINKAIDESEDLAEEPASREALKAAAADFIDAFEATMKAGQVDGGAALHLTADSMSLVAGAVIKDTAKVESALKKLDEAAKQRKDAEYPGIKWDAATHAGVKFHTLAIPVPEGEDGPRKAFGDEVNIAVGIGKEAVYVALGDNDLQAIKAAIDASAAEPEKKVPPFELAVSLGPIMEFAAAQADEGEQKEVAQVVADMLRNDTPGRDHVRLVGQLVPNGLRYRFEAEEGALRTIGKAAEEGQKRRMQQNQ